MPENNELEDLYDDFLHDGISEDEGADIEEDILPGASDFDDEDYDEPQSFMEPDYGSTEDDDPNETPNANDNPESTDESIAENEIINDLLKAKGIADPTQINYVDDNGEIVTQNFYELPYEEQMTILKSSDDLSTLLDADEIDTVNFLRQNGVTLEETIKYYERKAVEDYINSQNISGLEISQYSDEELYALHLRNEYQDLTNEEIEADLQKQLEHPELFKKKVEKLRTEYKEIETQQLQEAEIQRQQQDEQAYEDLKDNLISIASGIEDVSGSGLDLDIDDKNEVLDYILRKDINGVSPFIKSLNNPQQLFELAWFAVKGKEAFNIVHDYYKKEIEKRTREAYNKGKDSAQPAQPKEQKSSNRRSVVKKQSAPQQQVRASNPDGTPSIFDLYNY